MTFHITAAADENYVPFVGSLLHSICEHRPKNKAIAFHLLANGVSEASIQQLRMILGHNGDLFIHDISRLADLLPSSIPPTIAITSYARLFLPSIIPAEVHTLLYLDCDTIINSELTPLSEMELEGHLAAGVLDTLPDEKSKTAIELPINAPYYNAGILLINLKAWREENLQSAFLQYLSEKKGKVHHHDQGILNHVLHGRWKTLPPQFNLTSNYFSHSYDYLKKRNTPFYSQYEIEHAKTVPCIIHYTEGFLVRPWVKGCKHPYKDVFLRHKEQTYWSKIPLKIDSRPLHVKILAWQFLHLPSWVYHLSVYILSCLARVFKHK